MALYAALSRAPGLLAPQHTNKLTPVCKTVVSRHINGVRYMRTLQLGSAGLAQAAVETPPC